MASAFQVQRKRAFIITISNMFNFKMEQSSDSDGYIHLQQIFKNKQSQHFCITYKCEK